MSLKFIEVNEYDKVEIEAIYEILKSSGEHLFKTKGLYHWKNPYPVKKIRNDAANRMVFVGKDCITNEIIHTFQLSIIIEKNESVSLVESKVEINKFATDPALTGRGIGTKSMEFIEKFCRENKVQKMVLDVYDKSLDAIKFYKSKGFVPIGKNKTKYFNVIVMEKKIN